MLSKNYTTRHYIKVRRRFKLNKAMCSWLRHKVFGEELSCPAKRWLKERGEKGPSRKALKALDAMNGVPDLVNKELEENPPVVYYCPDGRGSIKIGVTRNLDRRIKDLMTYGNNINGVVASELGGIELERARHKQFAAERVRGEWFAESDRLADWVGFVAASEKLRTA